MLTGRDSVPFIRAAYSLTVENTDVCWISTGLRLRYSIVCTANLLPSSTVGLGAELPPFLSFLSLCPDVRRALWAHVCARGGREQLRHARRERRCLERFAEKADVRAADLRLDRHVRAAGGEQDTQVATDADQPLRECRAAHLRHHDVGEQQIDVALLLREQR